MGGLQVAIKAAQASQALTKALNYEKDGNITLEMGEENWDKETIRLQEQLKNGDCKVNQIRFMIQKFMISHKKLGLQFDDEKNSQFKDLFLRCGKTPEDLRQQIVNPVDTRSLGDMAPAAAADLDK